MNAGKLFFYLAALISFFIAFKEGLSLIVMRGKLMPVIGTIIDVKTALPETYKQSNSKFGLFLYYINGIKYISDRFIQVPMSAMIGDTKSIKVIIEHPEKIYTGSFTRFAVPLFVSILSLAIGSLMW